MARLAEVGITPTEPLGDRAAELALELDEFSAMRRAALYATTDGDGGALTAD